MITFKKTRKRHAYNAGLCQQCHEPFKAKKGDAKFCSTKCRVAHHRWLKANPQLALPLTIDPTPLSKADKRMLRGAK